MADKFPVPDGWYTFGTFIDFPHIEREFSKDVGEDGFPLWERPREWECKHCGKPIQNGERFVNWPWIHCSGWYRCIQIENATMAEPVEEVK